MSLLFSCGFQIGEREEGSDSADTLGNLTYEIANSLIETINILTYLTLPNIHKSVRVIIAAIAVPSVIP